MKNVKFMLIALLGILVLFPSFVSAKSVVNNNGVEISKKDYQNFLKVYSDEYLLTVTQEEYDYLKTFDFDNAKIITKYFETTYNSKLNLITEKEITKEEYDNFEKKVVVNGNDPKAAASSLPSGGSYIETNAKKLAIALLSGSNWNHVTLIATWKGMPKVRSYDVIGIRGFGVEFRTGSQNGKQIYKSGSNYTTISYSTNGTNIKKLSNGYGISMNLVDNSISELQLITECDVSPTITHPQIFGSYQHAVTNLSLANSKNYTLGGAGLGSVFVYPFNISAKYDGMSGVQLTY